MNTGCGWPWLRSGNEEQEKKEKKKENEEEKEEEEEATNIESNNPHLAGGEKEKHQLPGSRPIKKNTINYQGSNLLTNTIYLGNPHAPGRPGRTVPPRV